MAISSNTLFHFTKDLDTIKFILNDKYFWPIYCVEYDKGTDVHGEYDALPMVCFCDIPLSQISEHVTDYGCFGIGISKQWGKDKISPVVYYKDKKSIMRSLYDRLISKMEKMDAFLWLSLLKRYYGRTWSQSKKRYRKKVLYNEREWRYIPQKLNNKELNKKVKDINSFNAKAESEHLRKHGLKFDYKIVKYIFVQNEEKKREFIQFINGSPLNPNEKDHLLGCILTLKQIKEDF